MLKIDKFSLLKQHFGHSEFRDGQEEIVDALTSGQDVIGVMPTGAGKSICYQLPALMLQGLTVVVSPLISLMKDQVSALSQSDIPSAYINSSLTTEQYNEVFRRAKNGEYKIIYVAPERLTTVDFLRFAAQMVISFVAVDEAHCVSQWGQDFRPSYLKIAQFVSVLPKRPTVAAFTATATQIVKTDIEKHLMLKTPLRITTGFDRPNLYFEVVRPKSKDAYLKAFLSTRPEQNGIIYCATRKKVESVCNNLRENGISATRYHAGLEDLERKKNQEDFVYDRARVMVATNAFGMGIDKSNVSFIVHYNMPKNIEGYYQEAGRAGRDGEKAHCLLLFSDGDIQTSKFLINHSDANEAIKEEDRIKIRKQDLYRLNQMIDYCKITTCLRTFILNYFGENGANDCGNCGNCVGEMLNQDITVDAQKILSGVLRVNRKYSAGFGITLIARMLHGSKEHKIFQLSLNELPTYGIMQDISLTQIREYIDYLIKEGYLAITNGEYPVVHVTDQAKEVLFGKKPVIYTHRKQSVAENTASVKKGAKAMPAQADEGLFAQLKALRTKLAQEENVPAYIIFSNAALIDMSQKQPKSIEQFLQVSGVGEVKAKKYGKVFLDCVVNWCDT